MNDRPAEIRPEEDADFPAVFEVHRLAFGGPSEAELVEKLRAVARPQVSLVATVAESVVGHVFVSPVTIDGVGRDAETLGLAPVAVLPDSQNQGIGSQLIRAAIESCRELGCTLLFVLGHPRYYPRFGFRTAADQNLRYVDDVPPEVFLVAELVPGALEGKSGVVRYLPEFGELS